MKKTLILILSVVCCAFSLTLKAQTNEANLLKESDSVEIKLSTRDYLGADSVGPEFCALPRSEQLK